MVDLGFENLGLSEADHKPFEVEPLLAEIRRHLGDTGREQIGPPTMDSPFVQSGAAHDAG
jgi:hypothetical protein